MLSRKGAKLAKKGRMLICLETFAALREMPLIYVFPLANLA